MTLVIKIVKEFFSESVPRLERHDSIKQSSSYI